MAATVIGAAGRLEEDSGEASGAAHSEVEGDSAGAAGVPVGKETMFKPVLKSRGRLSTPASTSGSMKEGTS